MTREAIDYFMKKHAKFFSNEDLNFIATSLEEVPDDKMNDICSVEYVNPATLQLISIFGGWWGIDRFMIDDESMGILKVLTLGCCGVLAIYDWFTIKEKVKKLNLERLRPFLFKK